MRRWLALMAMFAAAGAPMRAEACGGFFCNLTQRVDQTGERILFAVEGKTVTAHIQITYQGEAEAFSWVLPMPAVPTFDVGTDSLFTALGARTDPRFELEWKNEPGCNYTNQCPCYLEAATGGGDPSANGGAAIVLSQGEVGPYTFKVVSAADGGGPALFQWLNTNGYQQPPEAQELIDHYVDQNFVFVALKLQKGKSIGELRPLVLKYTPPDLVTGLACIPLKLTKIAAAENMPVFAWVLAKGRAVPMNFFHVVLNAKGFDWLNCAKPQDDFYCGDFGTVDCKKAYMDLVTAAADQANGHAFVTEFAGATDTMKDTIYREGQFDLEVLASKATPGAFMQEMMSQGWPRTPLVQEIIRKQIPKPDDSQLPQTCQGEQSFYAMGQVDECSGYITDWTFDAQAMADELDQSILTPMKNAQALFDHFPYMTRLFTTVSPDEMTKDPVFSFNADLPDVSNVHKAVGTAQCKPGSSNVAEKITITFENGDTMSYEGEFQQCSGGPPVQLGGPEGPSPVAEVQVLSETGGAESVPLDKVDDREKELDGRVPQSGLSDIPQRPLPGTGTNTGTFGTTTSNGGTTAGSGTTGGTTSTGSTATGTGSKSSSCQTGAAPGNAAPLALLLLLIAALVLQRRRE